MLKEIKNRIIKNSLIICAVVQLVMLFVYIIGIIFSHGKGFFDFLKTAYTLVVILSVILMLLSFSGIFLTDIKKNYSLEMEDYFNSSLKFSNFRIGKKFTFIINFIFPTVISNNNIRRIYRSRTITDSYGTINHCTYDLVLVSMYNEKTTIPLDQKDSIDFYAIFLCLMYLLEAFQVP